MTRGDGEMRLLLVDQWHVGLLVPTDMDEAAAEGVRDRIDASLRQWAAGASLGLAGILVEVEQ